MAELADFDIFDWIASGTVARRKVTIYNDLALAAEADDLERRLTIAEHLAKESPGERGLSDRDEVADLRAQLDAVFERWEASKAVWTVQALTPQTVREIVEALPYPPRPDNPPDDAEQAVHDAHRADLTAWVAAKAQVDTERNLRLISAAVVSVETSRGTATMVPVEAVRAIRWDGDGRERAHGRERLDLLLVAVNEATSGDVRVAPGESHARSTANQG